MQENPKEDCTTNQGGVVPILDGSSDQTREHRYSFDESHTIKLDNTVAGRAKKGNRNPNGSRDMGTSPCSRREPTMASSTPDYGTSSARNSNPDNSGLGRSSLCASKYNGRYIPTQCMEGHTSNSINKGNVYN